MGDHRPTITADFEMQGHKAHFDFGWCNWSDNGDGIDQRIVDWFREQVEIAMGRYHAAMQRAMAAQRAEVIEQAEREQLAILKAKYE